MDGFGAVGLGTCKIVQIELRQAAVEIGLVQVGLSIDDLVEILNRKYVIAEIKRITPNPHHMIGIHLCLG